MSEYVELSKSLAHVTQQLREYRLKMVLLCLVGRREKSRQLKAAELELTKQLERKLQSPTEIDLALEEIELLLSSEVRHA